MILSSFSIHAVDINVQTTIDTIFLNHLRFLWNEMSIIYKKAMPKMKSLTICFKVCCVLAASIMVGFWVCKFQKNEDITLIEYKSIMDLDDVVLPELSLCLREPFLPEPLNKVGVTKLEYNKYLMGIQNSTGNYQNIDYHNVTLNIFDYFVHAGIRFNHKNKQIIGDCYDIKNCSYFNFKNNYNGIMKGTFFKCFGVEINKQFSKHIDFFIILFNKNLSYVIGEASASILSFNRPNQLIRNFHGMQPFRWSNNTELGIDLLEVSSIEILKRRSRKEEPCMDNWMSYDKIIEQQHLENVGCRAPYQAIASEIPICDTKEKMNESLMDIQELAQKYDPPCQEMPNIIYSYGIAKHEEELGDNIALYVSYPDKWKVITQSQAVDVHALIGNIGGYIGLFLGRILQ